MENAARHTKVTKAIVRVLSQFFSLRARNIVYKPLLHEAFFYILAMNHILTCLARGDTPVACFLLTKFGAGTSTGCGGAGTFETLGVAWEELVCVFLR